MQAPAAVAGQVYWSGFRPDTIVNISATEARQSAVMPSSSSQQCRHHGNFCVRPFGARPPLHAPARSAVALHSGVSLFSTDLSAPITVERARDITNSHYMDRRTAAQYMSISEKFLATHLNDGPKRIRVGSKAIYRLSDVEAWMRQQEVCR